MDSLANLSFVVTALVAFATLTVSLRDRQAARVELRAAQARKITFSTPGGSAFTDDEPRDFLIRNDSSESVMNVSVTLVANPSGGPQTEEKLLVTHNVTSPEGDHLAARSVLVIPLSSDYSPEAGIGGDFAIVSFRDIEGRPWRRRSDTYELQSATPTMSLMNRATQSVDRLLGGYLTRGALRLARRSVRKNPGKIPAIVRALERAWGYWPAGTVDPWLLPASGRSIMNYDGLCSSTESVVPPRSS